MSRYNPFHRIHKGLRALLYDTSTLLQRIDFTLADEGATAISRLQFVIMLFEKYQHAEDMYVLPAMVAYEPGVADSFEQAHEEGYQLSKKLEGLINNYRGLSLPLEKLAAGTDIIAQFEVFTIFNLQHLSKEDQFVNKMLWRYYSDLELRTIAWQIISEAKPDFLCPYTKWILRGLNNNEIVRWLKEIQQVASPADYETLLKSVEAELPTQQWHLLHDKLFAGALAA